VGENRENRDNRKRDHAGKFLPGDVGGPGRPKSKRTELLEALEDAATADDVKKWARKVFEQATTDRFDKDGCNLGADMQAARLWGEYFLGRPKQQIELDGGQSVTSIQFAFIGKSLLVEAEENVQALPSNGSNGNGTHRLPPE